MQNTFLELPHDLPTFEAAVESLDDVPTILYHGLEHAAYKTSLFWNSESPNRKLDSGLAASLFRFHAMKFLRNEGLDAQPDGCHWKFNNIPFLGISFYYKQRHVRVLKGPSGILPGCGKSKRKKRFFNQLPSSYLVGNVPTRTTANLIVLWDFEASYTLGKLWLALPATGAERSQDVRSFWCEALPHPAESVIQATPVTAAATADDEMDGLIQLNVDEMEQEDTNVR